MNERIRDLAKQAGGHYGKGLEFAVVFGELEDFEKFAKLVAQDLHKKVIASILITDVVMEEKGQAPTSEDYIRAINNDFGVESC